MSSRRFARLDFIRRARPARRVLKLNELEARVAPAGLDNVDGNLAALYRLTRPATDPAPEPVGNVVDSVESLEQLLVRDQDGLVVVQIWGRANAGAVAGDLTSMGIVPTRIDGEYRLVEAHVGLDQLPAIAALPSVLSVSPVYRPVSRSGSVQTQGDAVMRSDLVRSAGFDGAPIKVGVLSDSALNIANSQATDDLPATVDQYLEFPATDEGRAMLEIVHDIAPGAGLADHSALESESSFADGIRKLAAIGSQVIVDDVGYFDEPFFQDGIVARAVDEVAAAGVTYVSAAGNAKDLSYEANFNAAGALHDFDPAPAPIPDSALRSRRVTPIR